jgi:hypothetical protein
VATYPTVDGSRDRLHRAGWSVGESATATRCLVCGSNGENQIKPEAPAQADACRRVPAGGRRRDTAPNRRLDTGRPGVMTQYHPAHSLSWPRDRPLEIRSEAG